MITRTKFKILSMSACVLNLVAFLVYYNFMSHSTLNICLMLLNLFFVLTCGYMFIVCDSKFIRSDKNVF